jgi:tetratricopeptide (TPR) repeat protein
MRPMTRRLSVILTLVFAAAIPGWAQADDWRALMYQGGIAENAGDYALAAQRYEHAARIAGTFEPGDSRRTVTFNGLAMMHDALGQFADAEGDYRQALAAINRSAQPFGLDRAMILANLATLYIETGRPSRAEKLLVEALAIHDKTAQPDEVRRAIVQNSLAELCIVTGKLEQAEQLLTASLTALERHENVWIELGIARNNMGVVRMYQGRPADAAPLLEQALAALEIGQGPQHPIVLRSLNNLATARQRNGNIADARATWLRAVDLAAAKLGVEHPLYGEILSNYAQFLRETGDKANGKALESRANRILHDSHRNNGLGAVIDVSALQRKSR